MVLFYAPVSVLSPGLGRAVQTLITTSGLVPIRSDLILVSLCQDAVLLLIKYLEVYLNNK